MAGIVKNCETCKFREYRNNPQVEGCDDCLANYKMSGDYSQWEPTPKIMNDIISRAIRVLESVDYAFDATKQKGSRLQIIVQSVKADLNYVFSNHPV